MIFTEDLKSMLHVKRQRLKYQLVSKTCTLL